MPPVLALFFCTIFVFFLLRLERKQFPEASFALWIPTIWMLLTASKPLGIWLGSAHGSMQSGSLLDRMVLVTIFCLGLRILAKRGFKWSSVTKDHPWAILLIFYMLISILWSDIPYTSFKRFIREMVAVIMSLLVLTERDPRQAVQSVFMRSVYILIPISLILIKYFPQYGVHFGRWSGGRMWVGVTTQKNGLGLLCIIASFFLMWDLLKKWKIRNGSFYKRHFFSEIVVLVIALYLMKGPPGAYPATAIVTYSAGLMTYVGLLWMKKHRIKLGKIIFVPLLAFVITFGTVTLFVGGSNVGMFTSSLGRNETLTGRTVVWERLLPIAMQDSIVGHGFGGFWTDLAREEYEISEGHSGYLEVLLELGFVGLFVFSMFLLSSCRNAQKELEKDFHWGCLCICFLLMATIHNISESSLNTFTSQIMACTLFLTISSAASSSDT